MVIETNPGELSAQQRAQMDGLRAAWMRWQGSGKRGTAWEFLQWYETQLRGPVPRARLQGGRFG